MSSNHIAVKVENLSKCYHIYSQPQDRLKQSIYPRLQRLIRTPIKTYFHEFWALHNVSFEIKKGETIGIIGRNGSGKSTLLQLICGTLTPTTGSVETKGRVAALLELGSGFNLEFTGRENVVLNGAVLGLSTQEINERFADIAAFADIGDFIEQPVKMYSSGMVVRLAFAVQAMVDPDILIVDEALAVGDEKFQRKCFARLEELKRKGTAILFVSHSGPQIVELCDAALLLEQGTRLMYSRPAQVVRAYQKLIYAPSDQQVTLAEEYKTWDQLNINQQVIPSPENKTLNQLMAHITESESAPSIAGSNVESKEEYFDSGLVSQTTTVYPIQGAEIISFRILDVDGNVVNLLSFGQNYQFEVSGRFLESRERVFFGIHIRTISGLEITGQRYPEEGKYVEKVKAGDNFHITYGFKMILLPGPYFSGCAVWSPDEPICLHRIIDAIMFRVEPPQKKNFGGYVDMSSANPVLDIS